MIIMNREIGNTWFYKESGTAATCCSRDSDYYTYYEGYEGTGASTSKLCYREMRTFVEQVTGAADNYKRFTRGTASTWGDEDYDTCTAPTWVDYTSTWVKAKQSFPKLPSPAERLKDIMHSRHAPTIIVPRRGVASAMTMPKDIREQRARETLRRVIGDEKFRSFLKNGFVSVHHRNGKVYQIFPDHGVTRVYDKGVLVERLCVVLQGAFPPTDSLIMRYLMILNDEEHFRSLAIKHSIVMPKDTVKAPILDRTLAEIFREMKAA